MSSKMMPYEWMTKPTQQAIRLRDRAEGIDD